MFNPPSCSTRTPALGARNNTSRQVLHSQSVEAFMTSICCCIYFIARSLEHLCRLSVEKSASVFFSSAGSPCQRCLWLQPIFHQRNCSSILHQCVHTAGSRKTFSLSYFICSNFAPQVKAASSPVMLYDSCYRRCRYNQGTGIARAVVLPSCFLFCVTSGCKY